jgi:serine/threonine-protein kinase PpkA
MNEALDIPGYKIESTLGEGGMATVYLAIQESLERKVALKVMNTSLVMDPSFCQRFLDEGKTIAKLRHPAIVTIYDIGCHNSLYYMAMEYIEGGTLKERLEKPVGVLEALDIIRAIASALGFAHLHSFVHRDVKPANILFRADGSPTLTDFGIAKALESDKQLTQMGYAVGTPEYMSPEQARAAKLDGRSDLYSLGIVFYELLTGTRPFVGNDPFATALMHIDKQPPTLPAHLSIYQPILDRLLAKHPDERFANAGELLNALDAISNNHKSVEYRIDQEDKTVLKSPSAVDDIVTEAEQGTAILPPEVDAGSGRRFPVIAVAAGLMLALMLALGVAYVRYQPESPGGPDREPPESQVPSAVQKRIDRLLESAEAHRAIGRLREPPGANAYDAYQMVLDLDPGNARARRGLREIEQAESAQ